MTRRFRGLQGGINVPNTPGNILKEVAPKDTSSVLRGTFLYWAAIASAILALVGALQVTVTETITRNISQIFLWLLFAILTLGLATIWFNVQSFQLVLGNEQSGKVQLKSPIEASCDRPQGGSRGGSAGGSIPGGSALPGVSTQVLAPTSVPVSVSAPISASSTSLPALPSQGQAVSRADGLVGFST